MEMRQSYCGYVLHDELSFDTELVSTVIAKLKKGKAADFVGLTAEHLLYCHPSLSLILSKLFRIISITRYIPSGFKYNYLVPIPKVKNLRDKKLHYDDFRGIAISPILSKVFEYCLLDKSESFLGSSVNQFGFKKIPAVTMQFMQSARLKNYVNIYTTLFHHPNMVA